MPRVGPVHSFNPRTQAPLSHTIERKKYCDETRRFLLFLDRYFMPFGFRMNCDVFRLFRLFDDIVQHVVVIALLILPFILINHFELTKRRSKQVTICRKIRMN